MTSYKRSSVSQSFVRIAYREPLFVESKESAYRNEATLAESYKKSGSEERSPATEPELGASDKRPKAHLGWDPSFIFQTIRQMRPKRRSGDARPTDRGQLSSK